MHGRYILLLSLILSCIQASAQTISLDKQYFAINEPVNINITDPNQEYSLSIISPMNVYKYLGISSSLIYIPQSGGNHSIELYNTTSSEILNVAEFYVTDSGSFQAFIQTDKKIYEENEQVKLEFSELDNSTIRITDGSKNFFFENPKSPLSFSPKKPGSYIVTLEKNMTVFSNASFNVEKIRKKFNIGDSKGNEITSSLKFYDRSRLLASKTPEQLDSESFYENKTFDLELFPTTKGVKKIRFRNLKIKDRIDLGIEDLNLTNFVKSYAIDPTKINFTDAVVTGIAQGKALYKCKDWNFSMQSCIGDWVKLMDIIPGREYSFNITNSDPGFGESGELPEPHTVRGFIYMADNITRAENGIFVKIVDNNLSTYVITQVFAPPIPQFKGAYSANLYGITGDSITVKTWNDTHYGFTDSILASTNTEVNATLRFPIASESNVSILYPPNNSIFGTNSLFNITAKIQIIRNNGTNCYATLNLTNSIATISGSATLYLGNITVNSSVISMWNLTGITEGKSNITVNASCQSDTYILDNLNRDMRINLTIFDLTKPEITLFSPYNGTEATNIVRLNFNASDNTGINNCSFYLNSAVNQTFIPLMYSIYTINLTLPAGTYTWKIGCFDNSSQLNYNESETRTFILPSWHFYYGNLSSRVSLGSSQNATEYTWNNQQATNLYVVETGTLVSWASLQALGENISNMTSRDDFYEADVNLSMTAFSDSINRSYTINNVPIINMTLTVYNKVLRNIPIINSTNNSNFFTGILWDTTDGIPEYNGSQDIIFVSKKNISAFGKYGFYDYELRIPATLKNHKLGAGTVSFYVEIV